MFYFRVDSNEYIAGGHLARCVSIAQGLIERGQSVKFLIADNNPVDILRTNGFDYLILGSDWRDLATGLDRTREVLCSDEKAVLVVDTYSITTEYVKKLMHLSKIVYLGSRRVCLGEIRLLINYSADIDYEFYNENYSSETRLLLGPKYAPIRKKFSNRKYILNDKCKTVLVTSGNTNKYGIIEAIIDTLTPILDKYEINIMLVVGPMFEKPEKIYQRYVEYSRVKILENVTDMSEVMSQSDIAISANGTTVYELAAIGVPTISFAMVEEQVASAKALHELGVVDYCGNAFADAVQCATNIKNRLVFYINNNDERVLLARTANSLIDGNGVNYICDELCELV